jgi:hypothetical protein
MASKKSPEKGAFNLGECWAFKALVFDLSESAAKQALYGVVQVLGASPTVSGEKVKQILDDARVYNGIRERIKTVS